MSTDFPRAWQICRAVEPAGHNPRCSYATNLLLCDCHVLWAHPEVTDDVMQGLDGRLLVSSLVEVVTARGFAPADPDLVSDRPVVGMTFLLRVHEGQSQYLSLLTADDRFLEAILHVHAGPLTLRSRKQPDRLFAGILRSWAEIEAAVGVVYAPLDPKARP